MALERTLVKRPGEAPAGLLVDLDGTLVDSEGVAARVLEDYLKSEGSVPGREAEFARAVVGRTWRKGLERAQRLGARFSCSLDELEPQMIERYRECLEREGVAEVPGASSALRALSKRFPIAVVSGSQRSEVRWNLERLGLLDSVQFFLGAEDVPNGKPEPDPFLEGASRLRLDPSQILVFEDSAAGIESALRASVGLVVAIEVANHIGQDQSRSHLRVHDWLRVDAARVCDWWQQHRT